MRLNICVLCLILGVVSAAAYGQDDLRQKYVGKSKCQPELKAATERYGIRLDKSQKAYLAAYGLGGEKILTIVQLKDDSDQCGTIRDVIKSQDATRSFVWECKDGKTPSDVVVGTWPAKHPRTSGRALEAWRVDLKQLQFLPVQSAVTCTAGNYRGSDEGEDLASWAEKRGTKHRPEK